MISASSRNGTVKKIKLEDEDEDAGCGQINGNTVHFEWEGDGGAWQCYSDEFNKLLVDAFNNDETKVEFDVANKVKMVVMFDKMSQKNKKTGWQRRLRIAISSKPDDSEFSVWQWEDEHGKWNPYSVENAFLLHQAEAAGKTSVPIEAGQRAYTVDMGKMEQVNDDTGVIRKVDCIVSDSAVSDEPSKATPAAAKSASSKTKAISAGGDASEKNKSGKSRGKSGKSGSKAKAEPMDPDAPVVKTVILKGCAPVDSECCNMVSKAHVFSESKVIWDCMLNQTNVSNNNNKYYLVQLLEEDVKRSFHVWQRWGRVGYKGQTNLVPCGGDLDKAKKIFTKKFSDKTLNDWYEKDLFEKIPGKYDLLRMDFNPKGADQVDAPVTSESSAKTPDSKLDKRLQDFLSLICDMKSMEEAVMELKYDAKKAPLGKLTVDQINAGYAALKAIETCINKKDFGTKLTQACNEFYTRIPHCFGMKAPPLIRTATEVKDKILLLEALGDIEIAIKILKMGDMSEHPLDRHYDALNCQLNPLDKTKAEFKMVEDYLLNTHATTHNQYKMKLTEVFECSKDIDGSGFQDVGNRMLLWHGSRITNWVGILGKGLRIAPPEAPVTGYMFGKGVYFADMSSKSANYCFASRAKSTGMLLLCEVALGKTNDLLGADYNAATLPTGTHSVMGMGRVAPDPAKTFVTSDGVSVPMGKEKTTGVTNPAGYTLFYNEFIVYDVKQIKMKYLCQVDFKFK